jgi:hypothetical protein
MTETVTEVVADVEDLPEWTEEETTTELAIRSDEAELATINSLDAIEMAMVQNLQLIDLPLEHHFTPGLYSRTIFMPKGTLLTSRLHLTEHQYVVLVGAAKVWIEGKGWELIEAGHRGITKAGTRRLLYIIEDCTWTTFHALGEMGVSFDGLSDEQKVELIEDTILAPLGKHLDGIMPGKETKWLSQQSPEAP